jgi:hypothetical protein
MDLESLMERLAVEGVSVLLKADHERPGPRRRRSPAACMSACPT